MLLDCTLRDGGYYTNWDFDRKLVDTYLHSVERLPIDIIEVGYRSVPLSGYLGEYYYCPVSTLDHLKSKAPSKQLAIMLNEIDISLEAAPEVLGPVEGLVDLVRLAVKPERFIDAIELATYAKKRGFSVAINLMYLSRTATDTDLQQQFSKLNGVVDYFNLVDSYGSMYPQGIADVFAKVGKLVDVPLGFHGHNNLELAFANSLAALEQGARIIDSTMTGMGRGAGNLKTELFLAWQASEQGVAVDYDALSTAVVAFEELQANYGWGTRLPYMVSGTTSFPQKEVMEWMVKRYYSLNSILRALQNRVRGEEDNLRLPELTIGQTYKTALLIAGGPSVLDHIDGLRTWIKEQSDDLLLIFVSSKHASYFSDITAPKLYCVVGDEGYRIEETLGRNAIDVSCVLPPYPREMGTYIPEACRASATELGDVTFTDNYQDSQTAVALETALKHGVKDLYTVGYDGYSGAVTEEKVPLLTQENEYLFNSFFEKTKINPISLTPTNYSSLEKTSLYSYLE